MADLRHPLIGQEVTLQAPTAGGRYGVPHLWEVSDLSGLNGTFHPLGPVSGYLPRPGSPVVITFRVVEQVHRVEGLVFEPATSDGGLIVRLPKLPEHRAHARFGVELPVEVQLTDDTAAISRGTTVDVSPGGLRLLIDRPLTADQLVFLALTIPDEDEPVLAIGEVVAESRPLLEGGYEARVRFSTIADEERGRLVRHVSDGVPGLKASLPDPDIAPLLTIVE